jgi:hypothetical protein
MVGEYCDATNGESGKFLGENIMLTTPSRHFRQVELRVAKLALPIYI